MSAWEAKIALLEAQLTQIQEDIARAQIRQQQSQTALDIWQGQHNAWMASAAEG